LVRFPVSVKCHLFFTQLLEKLELTRKRFFLVAKREREKERKLDREKERKREREKERKREREKERKKERKK
jgi:hypothetical protein